MAVKAFVLIRKPPFSRPSRSSVYLPLGRESLRILLRLRRPKATPREVTSSFSFYLRGLDQRGHCDGFLLSANKKFVNPVIALLEPAACDLIPKFISLFPFYILLDDSRLRRFYDHYPIFATKRSTSLCTGSKIAYLRPLSAALINSIQFCGRFTGHWGRKKGVKSACLRALFQCSTNTKLQQRPLQPLSVCIVSLGGSVLSVSSNTLL
jgi:hypothetical protein